MPSEWHPAWLVLQMLGYWQTLIAGLLAVGAAVFTIRATVRSADREIEAANRQIRTAQRQIDITLTLDRRRTADETHAFLVAVESAAGTVVANVCAARPMVPQSASQAATPVAYQARQRVISPIFTDLRPACVRLGGDLTPLFVRLGQAICAFAADWVLGIPGAYQLADRCGATIGFHDGLNAIEGDAVSLGQEAHQRLTLCEDEIRALAEAVATTAPIAKA
jgi:hypothetical protein